MPSNPVKEANLRNKIIQLTINDLKVRAAKEQKEVA